MISENTSPDQHDSLSRRKFIYNVGTAAATGMVLSMPIVSKAAGLAHAPDSYTVQQIIDLFIKEVPGGKKSTTVDTLKSGSGDTVVTGVVTSMFATIDVIRKTIDLGANFIIAHEPTFYNHADDTAWLQNDEVYQYKADLLKKHNIAVWRNHDYIHTIRPDGVIKGVMEQLEWQQYADKDNPVLLTFPSTSVKDLVNHTKNKLHIEKVRFIGDPAQMCTKVLFLPGAPGGQRQIQALGKIKPDLLICGELQEWETAEYVRDARAKGDKLSMAVIGHIASEEPGSVYMQQWLKEKVPGVKATHVYCGNSLSFL